MDFKDKILILFLFTFIAVNVFVFYTYITQSDIEYQKRFNQFYKVLTPEIPTQIDFAGENVPIELFYVRESLDRELILNTYWQSRTLLVLKRAHRYFPIIEPILKQYGIPDDFKYLVVIESELENKISVAGATGFWQFMKEAGEKYGLEINDDIDERYHLELSTIAACKYFLNSYKTYGNWTLTAASYNAGEYGISSRLDIQKTADYYSMNLPTETARYIYRILALKLIIRDPTAYGYYLRKKDLYPPIQTYSVEVDSSISSLADFANKFQVNYRILKEFNPWLRKPSITNKKNKKYKINFPVKGQLEYTSLQKNLNENEDKILINKLQRID